MFVAAVALSLLSSVALADAEPVVTVGAVAGAFASAPAVGIELDSTLDGAGWVEARVGTQLMGRYAYDGPTLSGYIDMEVAGAFSWGRSRLGPAVVGEAFIVDGAEQDCADGYGCRWPVELVLGPAIVVPSWAPGVRWSRTNGAGLQSTLFVGPQLALSYYYGIPILRIDLEIGRTDGIKWGLEANRYGGMVTVAWPL